MLPQNKAYCTFKCRDKKRIKHAIYLPILKPRVRGQIQHSFELVIEQQRQILSYQLPTSKTKLNIVNRMLARSDPFAILSNTIKKS